MMIEDVTSQKSFLIINCRGEGGEGVVQRGNFHGAETHVLTMNALGIAAKFCI